MDVESNNAKEKVSNTSYAEAKKARNQKQRDEKRLKLLESLIPETEAKIKTLEEKISTEYATDYIKLEEASLEKDSVNDNFVYSSRYILANSFICSFVKFN